MLDRQVNPGKVQEFMRSYEDATSRPHGYLMLDLKPTTSDQDRLKTNILPNEHGRTGRKKVGGRKEKCPTFRDSARLVPKKFFQKNYFGDLPPPPPPPSPKNFRSVYHFRGQKNFSDNQYFSEHNTNF